MVQMLFPQFQYVKFGPCGIIFLSKSFWHFLFLIKETVHITELCSIHLPERLQELYAKTFDNDEIITYKPVFNRYSPMVLHLLHNNPNRVIDYLYDEYTYLKYGIQKMYHITNNILPEQTHTLSEILANPIRKDSIVLSNFSHFHINRMLKRWKDTLFVLNSPKLFSNYINLWFRKDIKQKLKEVYDIRIAIT